MLALPGCAAHITTRIAACVAGGGKRVATQPRVVLKAGRREPGVEAVLCGNGSFQLVVGEVEGREAAQRREILWDATAELVVGQVQLLQMHQPAECTLTYGAADSVVGQVGSCQTLQLPEALRNFAFQIVHGHIKVDTGTQNILENVDSVLQRDRHLLVEGCLVTVCCLIELEVGEVRESRREAAMETIIGEVQCLQTGKLPNPTRDVSA